MKRPKQGQIYQRKDNPDELVIVSKIEGDFISFSEAGEPTDRTLRLFVFDATFERRQRSQPTWRQRLVRFGNS